MLRVNVIDSDVRRRARVANEFNARGVHAEIFEDAIEFAQSRVRYGLVFLCDEPGVEFARRICEISEAMQTAAPIVAYAEDPVPERIVTAMRAGALDYLKWPFEVPLVDAAFRRIARGDDRLLQQEFRRSRALAKVQNLSRREKQVLTLLVQGNVNKAIGSVLGISPRTVEIHRSNMMGKLGARTSQEAVGIGVHAGLDEAEASSLLVAA